MKSGDVKKAGQRAISRYRSEVGSIKRSDRNIKIEDREWEAIQAGAVSKTDLIKILNNSDPDILRAKATPRATTTISTAKQNRIKNMSASGRTIGEIASALGVSPSTVQKYIKGGE
jgi:DNA-binding NarL/FixJ family response regulator